MAAIHTPGTTTTRTSWLAALRSPRSPASPTTRIVLQTLAQWMDDEGGSCFPGIESIAERSQLSPRTVKTHLALAWEAGWIRRWLRTGRKSDGYAYQATLPDAVLIGLQQDRHARRAPRHGPAADRTPPADPRQRDLIPASAAPERESESAPVALSNPVESAKHGRLKVQNVHPSSIHELYLPIAAAVAIYTTTRDGGGGGIESSIMDRALPADEALAAYERLPEAQRSDLVPLVTALLPAALPAPAGVADVEAAMRAAIDQHAEELYLDATTARRLRAAAISLVNGSDATVWRIPRGDHSESVPWSDRPRVFVVALGHHLSGARDTLRGGLILAVQQQYNAFSVRSASAAVPVPGTQAAAVAARGAAAESPGRTRSISGDRATEDDRTAQQTIRVVEWRAAHPDEFAELEATVDRELGADPAWARHGGRIIERSRRVRQRIAAALDAEPAGVA